VESGRWVTRSYELGTLIAASVGEQMVSVRIEDGACRLTAVTPTERGTIRRTGNAEDVLISLDPRHSFDIYGTMRISGKSKRTILVPAPTGGGSFVVFFDEEGAIDPAVAMDFDPVWSPFTRVSVEPPTVRLRDTFTISTVNRSGGSYENWELVYSGRDTGALHLTYREFTRDDLAKPSFFQTLSYTPDASLISFRDLQLRIQTASDTEIQFEVTRDGMGNLECPPVALQKH
jgi:hypothetical protein